MYHLFTSVVLLCIYLNYAHASYFYWNGTTNPDYAQISNYAYITPLSPTSPLGNGGQQPVTAAPSVGDWIALNADCSQLVCLGCGVDSGNFIGYFWSGITGNTSCVGGGPTIRFLTGTTQLSATMPSDQLNATLLFSGATSTANAGGIDVGNPGVPTSSQYLYSNGISCFAAINAQGTPLYSSLSNESCLSVSGSVDIRASTKFTTTLFPANLMFLGRAFNTTLQFQSKTQSTLFVADKAIYFGSPINVMPYNPARPSTSFFLQQQFQANDTSRLMNVYYAAPFTANAAVYFYLIATSITFASSLSINISSQSSYPYFQFIDKPNSPSAVPSSLNVTGDVTLIAGKLVIALSSFNLTGPVYLAASTELAIEFSRGSGTIAGAISGSGILRVQIPSIYLGNITGTSVICDWGTCGTPGASYPVFTGTYANVVFSLYTLSSSLWVPSSTSVNCVFQLSGNATAIVAGTVSSSTFNLADSSITVITAQVSGGTINTSGNAQVYIYGALNNNVVVTSTGNSQVYYKNGGS